MKVKLGDVGMKEMSIHTIEECFYQIRNGANIKQGVVDGGYPITRIETTANDKFNRDRMGYAGITDIKKYESYVLEDGDLLMSHINSVQYLGRTVLYEKQGDEKIIHGMNLLGMKANRDILKPAYARYYFYSRPFREQVGKITKKSVNQASFAVADLKKIKIKVPDLAVQEEVVEILDRLNCVIEERQQELQKMDELIRARFIELFGDPQCNPHGYKHTKLSDIATYYNGLTYKPENVAAEGTIVLRSSNIQNSQLNFADTVRVDCAIKERLMVQKNDILMCSRNGSAKLVGKVALIKDIQEPMSFGAFMMIIRSHYFRYLMTYFQMDAFRQQIKTGATTTINQITGRMLDDVTIPLPPMSLVDQFATFVEQTDKSKLLSGCRLFHSWAPENRDKPKHVGVPRRKTKDLRGGRRQQ